MDKRHSYTETLIHSQCISGIVRTKFMKESQKKSLSRHPQGHRLRLIRLNLETKKGRKINLYPDILCFKGIDGKNIRGTFQAPLTGQKSRDFQPLSRHIFRPICPVVSDSFFILLVCFLLPISITDPALSSMIFPAHSSYILPLEGFGDILFL